MILDEVLESRYFDTDSMIDMFVEGFLYALEMQENGEKASSMEDLSDKLSEAANESISELSKETYKRASEKAFSKGADLYKTANFAKTLYHDSDNKLKSGDNSLSKKELENSKKTAKKVFDRVNSKLNKVRNQYHKFRDKAGVDISREKKEQLYNKAVKKS